MDNPKCQCALCKRLIEQNEVVSNACQECVNERDALLAKLDALKAEVLEVLEKVEYAAHYSTEELFKQQEWCLSCGYSPKDGHAPDCALEALKKKVETDK